MALTEAENRILPYLMTDFGVEWSHLILERPL
jgi:hypothetical protein